MQQGRVLESVTPFPGTEQATAAGGQAAVSESRTLVVGSEVSLRGDIAVCERLVVEGTVDGGVLETGGSLVVKQGGSFSGRTAVAEADIAGCFDGSLRVSGCLTIRAGGRVSGEVRYGSLRIETGGAICGRIDAASSDRPAPRPAPRVA